MELSSIIGMDVYLCKQMPPTRAPSPPSPLEPIAMDIVYKYNKLKSLKFKGGPNPLLYEEWLRKMQNLFAMLECLEHFKVQLATYQFEKEAEYW